MVDHNNQIYFEEFTDATPGGTGTISTEYNNNYDNILQELDKMGESFFQYCTGESIRPSWRYLSDVIIPTSNRNFEVCLETLNEYGKSKRRGMFARVADGDHIHILHDCAYTNSSCRCIWRERVKPFASIKCARTVNKPWYQFSKWDWYNVFIYFFLEKRGDRKIWFGGASGKVPTDAELVRWGEINPTWREMVRQQDSRDSNVSFQSANHNEGGRTDFTLTEDVYSKTPNKMRKFTYIKQKTKALLNKYFPSPSSAIKDFDEFRKDDLLIDPKNKDYVDSSILDFGKDINNCSLRQLYNILCNGDPKFFVSMAYGSLSESVDVINNLLIYQFQDDCDAIKQFLDNVVDIFDKKLPKTNCMVIHSPPSSGKNYFFDMLFAISMNYGQLGMANRNNQFAFQEAPNKRLLLWNEPNYESCLTDTLKMMMEGAPYTVRVKNLADQHVKRTPIFVLTNNAVNFMFDPAFTDRIYLYKWKSAPFLKDIPFKPFPMAFFTILDMYNVVF